MAKRRLARFVLTLVFIFMALIAFSVIAAWIGVVRGPSVPRDATLILRIGGELAETPPDDVIGQVTGGARAQTVRHFVETLRRAKNDARIQSVLVMPSHFSSPHWAKLQEIRDAMIDFRTSGKTLSAYLEHGGDREYYLATAADRIYLVPTSTVDVRGLATHELFLGGTLEKLGAQADFEKIGDYKTAPNQLTQTTFTPAHREMTEWLTRDMYDQLVAAIAERRNKSVEDVHALMDQGPFLARQALDAGLVDALAYEDQLDDQGGISTSGTIEGELYARSRGRLSLRGAPRVAVVYLSGVINSGDSGYDPMNGDIAGSRTIVKAIRAARADSSVRAIVLRIDSPGGSTVASDVIWRELAVTRDEKPERPLVASMSDLAASGGYYVAVAAPQIVAQPGTLTGSIGIFGGKFITSGALDKIGANIESVVIGQNAGMESPARPFTPSERAELREQIESFYQGFLEKVGQSRKMTPEQVDQVAQGRVWTGTQAQRHGLVDALGGLDRAIAIAKEGADIPADQEVQIVTFPPRRTLAELLMEQLTGGGSGARQLEELAAMVSGLRTAERRALGLLAAPARLFAPGEPLALMPFGFVR